MRIDATVCVQRWRGGALLNSAARTTEPNEETPLRPYIASEIKELGFLTAKPPLIFSPIRTFL